MEQILNYNKYLIVIALILLSGEAGLFAGVAFVAAGKMHMYEVIIIGTFVSFLGNMMYYYLGKFTWNKWNFLRNKFGGKIEKSKKLINKFGPPIILVSRFIYGIRNIIPICLGLYQVNIIYFTIFNIIGGIIWTMFYTCSGYLIYTYFSH